MIQILFRFLTQIMNSRKVHSDISVVDNRETATGPYSADPAHGQYCSHKWWPGCKGRSDDFKPTICPKPQIDMFISFEKSRGDWVFGFFEVLS